MNKLCLFLKWSLLIICKSLAGNLSMWIQHLYTQSCYSTKRFFWIPYFMAGALTRLGIQSWAKTHVLPWWVCRQVSITPIHRQMWNQLFRKDVQCHRCPSQGGWPGQRGPRRLLRGTSAPWRWQQWGMWEGAAEHAGRVVVKSFQPHTRMVWITSSRCGLSKNICFPFVFPVILLVDLKRLHDFSVANLSAYYLI